MSLETVIEENNTLLRELIAMWKTGASPVPSPAPAAPSPAPAAQVETKKPEAEQPKEEAKAAKTDTAAAVTYDQIKPLIIKLNTTKGREAAAGLLAEFGVTRGPELKPEQFADFFTRVTAALA